MRLLSEKRGPLAGKKIKKTERKLEQSAVFGVK
jgi:hypothetical protein